MSKINDLIKKLCPNGVEYKRIKDICIILKKGTLKTTDLLESGYPVINSGRNLYGYYNQYNNDGNAFTVAARGEYAGYINYFSDKFWAGGLCYPYKSKSEELFNTKFIYYCLKNIEKIIRREIVSDGSIPALNKGNLDLITIPIPPIDVQKEIVQILDKFGELEAELEARKSQYEFWRGKMLDDSNGLIVKLSDVSIYSKDRIPFSELNENNYVGVDNLLQNKLGKKISNHVPKSENFIKFIGEDILIGNIRPYLKKIWFSDCVGGTNGDVLAIRVKDKNILNPKYLFYVLSSDKFFEYDNSKSKGAKMPRGDKKLIMNYEFYLPDIEKQEAIVKILDNFEFLTNCFVVGIPAEIKLRRQQYEYYRNKLLSFERLS